VEYGSVESRSRHDGDHDFRYIINIYENADESAYPSRTPVGSFIFTATTVMPGSDGSSPDHNRRVSIALPPGNFRIIAWADHVLPGTSNDMYYSTADFANISVLAENDAHPGNIPWRDAFRGQVDVRVNDAGEVFASGDEPETLVEIPMRRPMARYRFVSTDLGEFISRHESSVQKASGSEAISMTPDLDDYRVVMRYTGYMPSVYNAHTDRPTDSRLGVFYDGAISRLDASTAELASDYVFVNGNETAVQVALDVYDRHSGARIASTDPVTVPLRRNHLTIVRGRFLTSTASGGIGILPDFNGDFNIEIR
ncbi:MAG: hypothetical protein K2G24_09680, partial [Muribaculaceae bacterium]|nr:hypothetical protein [Muribaculaceae bacterium]